jgi:hypothetical protein
MKSKVNNSRSRENRRARVEAEIQQTFGRSSIHPHELGVIKACGKRAGRKQLLEAIIALSATLTDQRDRIIALEARAPLKLTADPGQRSAANTFSALSLLPLPLWPTVRKKHWRTS